MTGLNPFIEAINKSILEDVFVKITLSKPVSKSFGLPNVYVRLVHIKNEQQLQFTYRYNTNDQTKNFSLEEGIEEISLLLDEKFRAATLFTLKEDIMVMISKKKKVSIRKTAPSFKNKLPEVHDKPKTKRILLESKYLQYLGISDKNHKVIPKMADKYRQINKYLEIIENLLVSVNTGKQLHIVDMGSGKGYLTFALYDYLINIKNYNVSITGIELRENLVDFCNDLAQKCDFNNLNFVAQRIEEYDNNKIDVLIALHACDTATDDAIYKGLVANAELIVCAPCCHKQVRQQVKGIEQESPLLKYGIFKERQFEMVTDTIRALLLEKHQYNTKVFEFISSEHTHKNVMLVGSKSNKKKDTESIDKKIEDLKELYHIKSHYLETLL